ncbi:transmembrane protein 254 isoform X1 [Notamacropus eugenii]|uniref:transmembrane protein 254 isoform X1 n=1 Tax=Notamacropus eugenii TaxID=9315 RepID=UPI003B6741B6
MEAAGRGAAYFKRGNSFWFAVIILAFGYYTARNGLVHFSSAAGVGAVRCPHRTLRMEEKKKEGSELAGVYFRRGSPVGMVITAVVLGYFTWVAFWPQSIPYQKLGPLGLFSQYLVDNHLVLIRNGYWLAWLIHVGEAVYAMILCNKKGITNGQARLLWFLQTFLFGVASLSVLLAYKPDRHKKK